MLLFSLSFRPAFGGGNDTADQNPFDTTPAAAAPAADEGNPFGGGDADDANRKFSIPRGGSPCGVPEWFYHDTILHSASSHHGHCTCVDVYYTP